MELTLTGASLTADGNVSVTTNAATSTGDTTNGQGQGQGQGHGHSHSHDGKPCTSNHGNPAGQQQQQQQVPANFQSIEKIPKEKLISNPSVLFSAIVTSIKGGTFETFKYLVDIVILEEKEKQAPMNWGTDILVQDSNSGFGPLIPNININTYTGNNISTNINISTDSDAGNINNTNTNAASKNEGGGNINNKECRSALGRKAPDGHTLVHWTAKRADDLRFIEYLTQHVLNININVNSTDNVGMTPLHWAATEGSIPVVNFILKHLDESCSGNDGHGHGHGHNNTGLSFSAHKHMNMNMEDATVQVKPINHPINSRDKSGCTPLLIASQYGHADLAAFLIKRGADPNAVDDSRDTALHWAAYKGAVPVCGLLLHLNGIVDHLDTIDAFGQTPLHLASLRGNTDVITYIIEQAEAYVDSVGASASDKGEKESSPKGASVSTLTSKSKSASASFPAKLLNIQDREGKTPLDLAIKKKKGNAELLLRQYMNKYCISNQSIWQKTVAAIKPFFSCNSWRSWLGLTSENGRPPRFIFWFVAVNLALALLYELVVYVPLHGVGVGFSSASANGSANANGSDGRLWDYMTLHYCTVLSFIMTIVFFIMVHQTDPGLLAKKNYANSSSNTNGVIGMDSCIDARLSSILCFDENKKIRREMHTLTNDLRNLYEETLESFASDSVNSDTGAGPATERLPLCHSCHIARPHRSKHCRVLNRCVLLFDHHCPFVGTTIGLYNYKYFYMFVVMFTITEILFGTTGILYLKRAPENAGIEVTKLIVGLYFSIYMLMTGGLSIYHTQLVRRNLTTNEHQNARKYKYLKDEMGAFRNPYNRGCFKNFASRLFPGKDSYMLVVNSDDISAHASSLSRNSSHHGMEIEMRSATASDKKNEEKLSLVQNAV